jgi:lysophospholipase L1-like esterase
MDPVNRREFLLTSALFTSAACRSRDGVTAPPNDNQDPDSTSGGDPDQPPSYTLSNGARIVFQGASETDSDREGGTLDPNNALSMGHGYPLFIAQHLLFANPQKQLQIFNRARGGDTVPLLQARWQTDTIDVQPDLLSILIGLNDYVANYNSQEYTSQEYPKVYEANYKALIDTTRHALPNTQIVIIEPYVIYDQPVPDFDAMRAAAQRVATYADAIFVPIHDMLNQHVSENGHAYWFNDQHPTIAGSAAIANQWLKVVGL